MITEDYVSFETAKLLKDKGFDENCAALYDLRTGEISQQGVGYVFNNSQWENFITAPTLQMAMKWLREVHNIAISVYVFNRYLPIEANDIIYTCDIATTSMAPNDGFLRLAGPYEEVCESAIKHCLEKLI